MAKKEADAMRAEFEAAEAAKAYEAKQRYIHKIARGNAHDPPIVRPKQIETSERR